MGLFSILRGRPDGNLNFLAMVKVIAKLWLKQSMKQHSQLLSATRKVSIQLLFLQVVKGRSPEKDCWQ